MAAAIFGRVPTLKPLVSGRAVQTARAEMYAAAVRPAIEAARASGARSLREIGQALVDAGIRPPYGNERWHAQQVRRLILRFTVETAPT